MKRLLLLVIATAALIAAAPHAAAQELRFGAQGSYGDFSDLGVGARAEMGLGSLLENLGVSASFDYFFESDGTDNYTDYYSRVYEYDYDKKLWSFNLNAIYDLKMIPVPEMFQFYAGGGLNYTSLRYSYPFSRSYYSASYSRRDDDDGFGLNALAGCRFNVNLAVVPFVELRYTMGVVDQFIATAGVSYSLPR